MSDSKELTALCNAVDRSFLSDIFQPNTASMQVLSKNGFVHEATLRNAVIKNNEIYKLCIFGLTKQNK